jgi:hypothetical protein
MAAMTSAPALESVKWSKWRDDILIQSYEVTVLDSTSVEVAA